ncbi:MAG: hypothetical protein ACKOBV_11210, partial [Candidatus Kapaibacterium sp.]
SLVAFGALPYVVRDVGQASLALRDAVVRFPLLRGGRDVTSAMLDSLCGAIAVSRCDTRARGIVLITDVQSSLPADSVLRALRDAGSRLFVLTLDACASASMRAVAHASGGVCMDSVPVAALGAALRACAFILRGAPSATIEWPNDPSSCNTARNVRFDILSLKSQLLHRYSVPDSLLRIADFVPSFIDVPDLPVGDSIDIPITVVARGADFTVNDVTTDDPDCRRATPVAGRIVSRASPLATTLRFVRTSDKERRIMVSIQGNACRTGSAMLIVRGSRDAYIRPRLGTAIGGRVLRPRSPVSLAWSGLEPDDSVVVHLSTDAGSTWFTASPSFGGTSAVWTVPAVSSDRCLLLLRSQKRGTADTSAPFRIAVADLPVSPIAFGRVRSSDAVDRVFADVWRNTRTNAVRVDSVRTSSGELRLLRGEDCTVPAGSSWNCVLQLESGRSGDFVDTLSVFTDDDMLRIPVSARITDRIVRAPSTILFDRASVGGVIDTVVDGALTARLTADQSVTCSRIVRLSPDTLHYDISAPGVPLLLDARRPTWPIVVRFAAMEAGLTSSRILVEGSDGTEEIRLVGNAVCGAPSPLTRITLPDTVAETIGGHVIIPLRYAPLPRGYTPVGRRPWTLTLRVPADLLYPVAPTPQGEVVSRDRRVVISGSGFDRGDTLVQLRFIAALGASDEGRILVESFRWTDECGGADGPQDARFVIVDACKVDGLRSYLSGDSLHVVSIVPNPAREEAVIRYALRETGPTAIELVDVSGRILRTIPWTIQTRGVHETSLPLDDINVGEYYVRILTPAAAAAAVVKVVR